MELERHQSNPTILFDPILESFENFRYNLTEPRVHPNQKNWIRTVRLELRFFKMLLWGLDNCQESQTVADFRSDVSAMGHELIRMASASIVEANGSTRYFENSEPANSDLEKRIQQFKPRVKEICCVLLDGAALKPDESCPDNPKDVEEFSLEYGRHTASFIQFVLQNLEALYYLKVELIPPVKQQIAFITPKFKGFANFADPATHWIYRFKNLGELMSRARIWATHLTFLACLYWIDGMDESMASNLGTMLSDFTHKTLLYTPGVVASCLEATLIPQLFAGYIDFLFEDLVISMNDDIEILREGLIFMISFMLDPPEEGSMQPLLPLMMDPPFEESQGREMILGQIYAILNEFQSLIYSIKENKSKEGLSQSKLSDLLQKIDRVKSDVIDLYAVTTHSSQFDTPRTNAIGFLDSLLRKLKKMLEGKVSFIPTIKHRIKNVQEELTLLKPFLQNNMELHHEWDDLKDVWTWIINLVYYAAYVTDLCPATSFPIWYPIICLSSVIEEITLIKNEVKELSVLMDSGNRLLPQVETSKIEGPFIGFGEETASIIHQLKNDQRNRTIICISGMPGQGKTTLARRIYNDPSIQHHFHIVVWCYVSKGCKGEELLIKILQDVCKELLIKILQDVCNNGAERGVKFHDLADLLWKSLKGKRYLIVLDDIWDVDLWPKVQAYFPNDKNGSRIVFTSRNHNLALGAEPNSISHPLRLFSPDESWELVKAVLNFGDVWELEFLEIGKQVSICCKGLPLAIAITASILQRTEKKLDLWMQVAKNLNSHLASEGFMDIIELSYKYLPDQLKPCFLYFAAFPRGESIPAKRLKLLWMAEGFIKENETGSPENLAKEYLENLVRGSLIVVTERCSLGEIKRCNVHDLLYDLCSEKAAKENFLYLADYSTSFVDEWYSSPRPRYSHHRLCIGASDPFIKPRRICIRKELPTCQVHSLLWSRRRDRVEDYYLDFFIRHHFGEHVSEEYSSGDDLSWFFKNFKVLTVLDLETVYIMGKFPEVILSNIHLRYLALKGGFDHIPTSIGGLWDLETLIIKECDLVDLVPDTLWQMESLRHVNIDNWFSIFLGAFEQNNSCMAASNIETLCGPMLGYNPQTAEFLRRLPRLRKLHCRYIGKEMHPMWFSIFGSLKHLERLKVRGFESWSGYSPQEKLPPSCNLSFPKNLRKLTLELLEQGWDAFMSTIGKQLQNLEVLKLNTCEGICSWDLEDGDFSKLRILILCNLEIEKINVSNCDNPFPRLEKLVVEWCNKLEEIPSSFGDICCLDTIKVYESSPGVVDSARRILDEQRYLGNDTLQVFVTSSGNRKMGPEIRTGFLKDQHQGR